MPAIKGTIRDTYLVESSDATYVCSIYRHRGRAPAEIAAELELLAYLHAQGAAVAPAVPTRTGERLLAIRAPEGPRHAVLFAYIPGRHLERQPDPELARRYGRAIARVHVLADAYPVPLARPRCIAELLERPLAAFASVVAHRPADVAELRAGARVLARWIAALPTAAPGYGVVHGDVIPSNAQVTPAGEVTILDFDFCGYGWRAYDVATYLGEVRSGRRRPPSPPRSSRGTRRFGRSPRGSGRRCRRWKPPGMSSGWGFRRCMSTSGAAPTCPTG